MSGWTMPIQQASYNGVQFEVISVDDSFERSVVEHAYPFVNGTDLEDMGLNAQVIRMQAVLFGEGYYTDYKKFLAMLQDKGAATLVHPVRGRMPNMLLISANLRHDAENVNYVAIDLTFQEATEMQPIFVFESSLLSRIDKYLKTIEDLGAKVTEWWAKYMEVVAFGQNAKKRLQSQWSVIYYTAEQMASLLTLEDVKLAAGVSKNTFLSDSKSALKLFEKAFKQLGDAHQFDALLSVKTEFNELARDLQSVLNITDLLATKQTQRITSAEQFFKQRTTQQQGYLTTRYTADDLQPIECTLRLMSASLLAKSATEIIEEQAEDLTPADIEYLTNEARAMLLDSLNFVRKLQKMEQTLGNVSEPNNGLYTASYQLAEALRDTASELMQIAITAINQKPPLTVTEVKETGTMQQVAHYLYRDYERSEELLRLNPQIIQPNYIKQGTLLNCYAE